MLKFSIQELAKTLELGRISGEIVLTLTGYLNEEAGGTAIHGQDCVLVVYDSDDDEEDGD